jgi:hypothetical protein
VLIIAGFAVLSREYTWARSGLALARRHAGRTGEKVRSMATRRRGQPADGRLAAAAERSGEIVIDLTEAQDGSEESNVASGSS